MTNAMTLKSILMASVLGAAPFAASAADFAGISELSVGVNNGAPEDSVAAMYEPMIQEDLEKALVARIANLMGVEDGVELKVTVTELALDDKPITMDAPDFNQLEGVVSFYEDGAEAPFYNTLLEYNSYAPAGTTVLPSTEAYYTAMIERMADDIADIIPSEDFAKAASILHTTDPDTQADSES
jgi:hypothetical protein